ncbi:MAG TPA: polysaccharide deacetylase family protein [Gemmatimonadaceae bacterium]|nr:polysaccharide deacetylase family protein [Gemmatimonadaceae bacterium]
MYMQTRFLRNFALSLCAIAPCGAFATAFATAGAQQHAAVSAAAPAAGASDSQFVPILVYHGVFPHHPGQTAEQIAYDVAPEKFEEQMQYLKDHDYHVVSFATLVDALEQKKTLPERTVVITLDDGRENQYVHAFPILKKFGYTATFFVYPNPVDRVSDFMTWAQLKEMVAAGMTIGCHTQTHPYLTKIKDPKTLKWEIVGSREKLEQHLGVKVEFLAYPFGLKNPEIEAYVKEQGYRAARAFPGGVWQSAAIMYSLKGLQITDNMKSFERMIERPRKTTP